MLKSFLFWDSEINGISEISENRENPVNQN